MQESVRQARFYSRAGLMVEDIRKRFGMNIGLLPDALLVQLQRDASDPASPSNGFSFGLLCFLRNIGEWKDKHGVQLIRYPAMGECLGRLDQAWDLCKATARQAGTRYQLVIPTGRADSDAPRLDEAGTDARQILFDGRVLRVSITDSPATLLNYHLEAGRMPDYVRVNLTDGDKDVPAQLRKT